MSYDYEFTRKGRYVIGVDLGQANDSTAVAVLDIVRHFQASGAERHEGVRAYQLVGLFRPPLGTTYPTIATIIAATIKRVSPYGPEPFLVVDATGVGRPVVDMLRTKGLHPIAVTITGGREETQNGSFFNVPKRNLVSAALIALQTEKLKFAADLDLIEPLRTELSNFKSKLTSAGNETFEAGRESIHDDLVLALALAVWQAERARLDPPRKLSNFMER